MGTENADSSWRSGWVATCPAVKFRTPGPRGREGEREGGAVPRAGEDLGFEPLPFCLETNLAKRSKHFPGKG